MDYRSILPTDRATMVAYSRAETNVHEFQIAGSHVSIAALGTTPIRAPTREQAMSIHLAVDMPQALDAAALRTGLAEGGELALLIDRVIAGHSVGLNDTGNERIGILTPDAQEAWDILSDILADADSRYASSIVVWSARDWLTQDGTLPDVVAEFGLTADSTSEQWDAVIVKLMQQAAEFDDWVDEADLRGVLREAIEDEQ